MRHRGLLVGGAIEIPWLYCIIVLYCIKLHKVLCLQTSSLLQHVLMITYDQCLWINISFFPVYSYFSSAVCLTHKRLLGILHMSDKFHHYKASRFNQIFVPSQFAGSQLVKCTENKKAIPTDRLLDQQPVAPIFTLRLRYKSISIAETPAVSKLLT